MIPRRSSISKNRISCKIVTPKAIDMLLISLYRTATLCICETYGHDLNLWVFVRSRAAIEGRINALSTSLAEA